MAQIDGDLNKSASHLGDSLANAEKVKARAPFEAKIYMELQDRYVAREDFESAAKVSAMGQSLSPKDESFLYSQALIRSNIGARMINRDKREKEFRSVIESLTSYLAQVTDDVWRGYIHYWLGYLYGDLREYDRS